MISGSTNLSSGPIRPELIVTSKTGWGSKANATAETFASPTTYHSRIFLSAAAWRTMVCPTGSRPTRVTACSSGPHEGKGKMTEGENEYVQERPKYYQDCLPRPVRMQGTSRILSLGIGVREIVLAQDLPSDAEDRMRYAHGGPTRGWNESKRREVNAKGDRRNGENPKSGSHRLTGD